MRIPGLPSAATPSFTALSVVSRLKHWLERALVPETAAGGAGAPASVPAVPEVPERAAPVGYTTTTCILRVVHESDAAIGAECAGRMVISGRMADVCAELDRMALRAAARQKSPSMTAP